MFNQESLEKFEREVIAKDLSNLSTVVNWAQDMLLHGSFSDRRPDLGKMFTCPFCHRRRRQGDEKCCNARPATTVRAYTEADGFHQIPYMVWDDTNKEYVHAERENVNIIGKSFLKRLTHKKHGQNRVHAMKFLSARFQENQELLEASALEMRVPVPAKEHIPAFAEKYFVWKENQEQRRYRRQQKVSRRINFGLARGGSR